MQRRVTRQDDIDKCKVYCFGEQQNSLVKCVHVCCQETRLFACPQSMSVKVIIIVSRTLVSDMLRCFRHNLKRIDVVAFRFLSACQARLNITLRYVRMVLIVGACIPL